MVRPRRPIPRSFQDLDVAALYTAGKSIRSISKQCKTDVSIVKRYLLELGVKIRPNKKPKYYRQFYIQKGGAAKRGIAFALTFEQWLKIWKNSGHLHERGKAANQYCMARFGDKGPYAVGNVKIILSGDNTREGPTGPGSTRSLEQRKKVSATKTGVPMAQFHKDKISKALKLAYKEGRR